jgi:lipid A 3-O-deacylase
MSRQSFRNTLYIVACCLAPCLLHAQQQKSAAYNKEFSFTTDNDAYLLGKGDAYYTNGFFLRYAKAGERKGIKITRSYEIGQMIFTPLIRLTNKASDVDRPYAGYLFARYNRSSFANSNSVLQYGVTLGVVGPSSFGKDVQNWYHSWLHYGRFTGWKYQVQDAFGADLHFSYARTVLQDTSWIKLVPVAEARLGTNFTNAGIGAVTCIGRFVANSHSALFNARVEPKTQTKASSAELFFYWYPQVILQGYNATVEGGMFGKGDTSAVLGKTNRWMFQQTWGACYSRDRWTARLAVIYQSREALAQTNPQRYVSIQVSYRIH